MEFAIAIYIKYASSFLQKSGKFSIFKYFWQDFSPFKETELKQNDWVETEWEETFLY